MITFDETHSIDRKTKSEQLIDCINELKVPAFYTGTYSWNIHKFDSDVDICIPKFIDDDVRSFIVGELNLGDSIYESNYRDSFSVNIHDDGNNFNIINLSRMDLLEWYHATIMINYLINFSGDNRFKDVLTDSQKIRHSIFMIMNTFTRMVSDPNKNDPSHHEIYQKLTRTNLKYVDKKYDLNNNTDEYSSLFISS